MRFDHRRARRPLRPTAAIAAAAAAIALTTPTAGAAAGVLVDETFGSQTSPANFGFPTGAAVTGGVLNVTSGMRNHTTSAKAFDAAVVGERTLDLTFDWRTAVASSGHKTGIELRDSEGNLVFSLAGTGAELRYGATGPVSDSTAAPDSLNPTWTRIAYDRTKWHTVDLHLDFTVRRVQYTIATKETAARVMASGTADMTGGKLAKLVACNYYGTGVQSIDNFRLSAPANAANGQLRGKAVYAFGDSIVHGHTYARSFVNLTAERELMNLTEYAVNGAAIGPAGNQIVYVAVHKLGSRDWSTQLAIRAVTLQISDKWGVTVADVFEDTALDTRIDSHRVAYTFNGLVNGYPGTGGTGTHPNIAGITAFYVPILTDALTRSHTSLSG